MSDVGKLIEKFSMAILGEEPAVVMSVLVAFVGSCCEQWKINPENFCSALLATDEVPELPKGEPS